MTKEDLNLHYQSRENLNFHNDDEKILFDNAMESLSKAMGAMEQTYYDINDYLEDNSDIDQYVKEWFDLFIELYEHLEG